MTYMSSSKPFITFLVRCEVSGVFPNTLLYCGIYKRHALALISVLNVLMHTDFLISLLIIETRTKIAQTSNPF